MIQILPLKNQVGSKKSDNKPNISSPFKFHSQPHQDKVSFGGHIKLMDISGIPCPYCGQIMVSVLEQKAFGQLVSDAKGRYLREALSAAFKGKKSTLQKQMANVFMDLSRRHPDKTMQEMLIAMAPTAEGRLANKQLTILKKSALKATELKGETRSVVSEIIANARKTILAKNPDAPFKRKAVLEPLFGLEKKERKGANGKTIGEIIVLLKAFPTSTNDKNAFVTKYQRRSSREIGETLLQPYTATEEHIDPFAHSRDNSLSNKMTADTDCNGRRSGLLYRNFMKKRRHLAQSIQNSLTVVDEKIKQGLLTPEYVSYIRDVSLRIYMHSEGKMRLPFVKSYPSIAQVEHYFHLAKNKRAKT